MEKEELYKLQKQEVLERLRILQKVYKVHPNVLKEYKQDETIYYSERVNIIYNGILYWLSNEQKYVDAVKEILTHTEFGDWLDLLFVSDTPDNWASEKSKLMIGFPESYTYDFSRFGSEFGDIKIKGINGGLTRVS